MGFLSNIFNVFLKLSNSIIQGMDRLDRLPYQVYRIKYVFYLLNQNVIQLRTNISR